MVCRSFFQKKWWLLLIISVMLIVGFGYGWVQMNNNVSYTQSLWSKETRERLDRILATQKHAPSQEVLDVYLRWKDRLPLELENAYQLSIINKFQADNVVLLANGEDAIDFDSNVPGDFAENKEAYAAQKKTAPINDEYLTRFFLLEPYNVVLLAGILLSVCFWGEKYENGTNQYMQSSRQGQAYRMKSHLLLLGINIGFVILAWLAAMALSGLLGKSQYWWVPLRSYRETVGGWRYFSLQVNSLSIMGGCLLFLGVQICNNVLFYLIGYWFSKKSRTVRTAFLGSVGVLLALYFIRKAFEGREKESWFQFGYQGDIAKWIANSEWVSEIQVPSMVAGATIIMVVTCMAVILWIWRELRNPYQSGRSRE